MHWSSWKPKYDSSETVHEEVEALRFMVVQELGEVEQRHPVRVVFIITTTSVSLITIIIIPSPAINIIPASAIIITVFTTSTITIATPTSAIIIIIPTSLTASSPTIIPNNPTSTVDHFTDRTDSPQ
ncbi:hypothetical protein Pcinc_009305 [Petrolisthes cinctipes]|uniref:Uncharacterized protein n=1 Tax=Petrolisthes cinctipes TaxID=88211 RepID=A0AAE1KYM6_PETCI|nr:hypothetical protein Pcinc_023040 [Petrolisthes cinctipes]KAK3886555.1 hypothetical protein Pcinc_009305 [Petrolisthes cinctipes]